MNWKTVLGVIVTTSALSVVGHAQTVTKGKPPVTETMTIQQIDATSRLITFRNAKGEESTIYAGPDVKRFAELKVGQMVKISYYESTVYTVARADQKTSPLKEADAVTPGKGALPGGTIARQLTATVDVTAVDPAVPSITVRTAGGRTITRKVEDPKNLAGVKVGDRIVITYTEAALIQVE